MLENCFVWVCLGFGEDGHFAFHVSDRIAS